MHLQSSRSLEIHHQCDTLQCFDVDDHFIECSSRRRLPWRTAAGWLRVETESATVRIYLFRRVKVIFIHHDQQVRYY